MNNYYDLDVLIRKTFVVKADTEAEAKQLVSEELSLYEFEIQGAEQITGDEQDIAREMAFADEVIDYP